MRLAKRTAGLVLLASLMLGPAPAAWADRVRFHFAAAPTAPAAALQPAGPGQRISLFGTPLEPYTGHLRATYLVTFRHFSTGQLVTVPLALPEGTPHIAYVGNRIVYGYTSYTVDVVFLSDGSVDVIYDSGFLRPL
jgi:hypothetical protein